MYITDVPLHIKWFARQIKSFGKATDVTLDVTKAFEIVLKFKIVKLVVGNEAYIFLKPNTEVLKKHSFRVFLRNFHAFTNKFSSRFSSFKSSEGNAKFIAEQTM
jgi:hypothetical protein